MNTMNPLCRANSHMSLQAAQSVSDEAKRILDVVARFVEEECIPYVALPDDCQAQT